MAQAVLLTCFTFLLSATVALSVAMVSLHYKARALKLESKPKQNLAKEIDHKISHCIIPAAVVAVILAGIFLVWFWLTLLHVPAG